MKSTLWRLLTAALLLAGALRPTPAAAAPKMVLVEAESFKDLGGWGLDQQFMNQMGSPYLLAHGIGTPVQDAVTEVKIEQAGSYKLWVRTMDWVARWNAPGTPGKFQVMINGKAAPVTFGTEGAKWHWQEGGTVELAGALKLALHDLTGFEGRCDAILLSADPSFIPPNELEAMAAWRQQLLEIPTQPEEAGAYDLVVIGGGVAGACAAINAARLGLKVAVIQDRAVLGGNNSGEVRVPLSGKANFEPYPKVGDVTAELEDKLKVAPPAGVNKNTRSPWTSAQKDAARMVVVKREKNITLFMEYRANDVETADKKIQAVTAQNLRNGRRIRLTGKLFADCTGDGEIGARAGADFEMTRFQHMGPSNQWHLINTGTPAPFPRCPWALDLTDKPFPGREKFNPKDGYKPGPGSMGGWFWESGADWDPITQVEDMRDWNLRAMYGAWDALKNVDGLYPNHKIGWAAYVTGKRESRRLLGDLILSQEDLLSNKKFEDGCYPCSWGVDLHYPHPAYNKGFEGKAFISYATAGSSPTGKLKYEVPYWAPYRTLYSRNIGNLFMAGRDVSVTHDALGAVRVIRTTGVMGEIVGMAAAICIRNNDLPRDVYTRHLADLKALMASGVPAGRVPDVTQTQ